MEASASSLLVLLVALPFVMAVCTPLLARLPPLRGRPGVPAVATALICFAGFVALRQAYGEVRFSAPWIPTLGVDLALQLDGLAFLFALLVTGIGVAILAFSGPYVPHDFHEHGTSRRLSTFYAYVLFFMGSMLGLVCADDLVALYVFWEATSVSSFLLIAIYLGEEKSRKAAVQAFVITASAGLALFVAILMIGAAAGTLTISALADHGAQIAGSRYAPAIVAGVVIGAGAKSAQAPLHIWLPNAMVAPTPVSAYLHSATMVAAGVFLLARIAPLLAGIQTFGDALIGIGMVTMIAAGLVALSRNGLKEILAWSTISLYGYATLLLGLQAWGAALFVIANHAILKAGLFLCAGVVTYATGRTDVRELGGLWRTHKVTTLTAAVLSLGLAGVPGTSGFWMKELLYKGIATSQLPWLEFLGLTAGVLTFVYMLRFFWRTFVSGPAVQAKPERELASLLAPTVVLAMLVLAVGVVPSLAAALTDPAASSAANAEVHTKLALAWPPDRALELTLATFVIAPALFAWLHGRERGLATQLPGPFPHPRRPALSPGFLAGGVLGQIGPSRLWDWMLPSLDRASVFAARLQTGKLVHYLLFLVAVPVLLAVALLPDVVDWPTVVRPEQVGQATIAFGTLAVAATGLAIASALVHSHIAAILMVGGVGFLLALIYSILRAPDVALVQVAVETVTALLLLIALSRVRVTVREEAMSPQGQRPRAARAATVAIAISSGVVVTTALLALQASLGPPTLGRSFFPLVEELYMQDVVTAILVDFRGFDTFGEITVFAAAVLGAVLLLGPSRDAGGRRGPVHFEHVRRPSVVVRITTRLTFPVVLLFAAEHIINAPEAPGEGFSGGLLTAMSILLLYVGLGYERVERELRIFGNRGLLTGIALALFAGFLGFATDRKAFLASDGVHPTVLGSTIHLTTHMLFDVAIFFVVASGALGIFRAIGGRGEAR